jgi:fatty acid desaturase
LLIGIPASSIAASHIYNHHRHTNNDKDWMRSTLVSDYQGVMRLVRYILYVLRLPRMMGRPNAADVPRQVLQNTKFESKILLIFYVVLLLVFPIKSTVFYFSTRIAGLSILFILNLIQHDELEHEVGINRSRNFVGRWINTILFNNGYHAIHHLRPDAHWSELPQLHREFVSHLAKEELTQTSVLAFIFKKYLAPRRFRILKILH